jgi:hypothetical protein
MSGGRNQENRVQELGQSRFETKVPKDVFRAIGKIGSIV